ncbi:MAG: hypothetical protein GY949_01965 [Gammaproteobacteria bacterium]|nr:hypothetical protein [Gammaproteobacteria bacterium]
MLRLSRMLDDGINALVAYGKEYAIAEDTYRAAKATAYLAQSEGTVDYRRAKVDSLCTKERGARNMADAMHNAAREAVRARRQQLSAMQSLLAAHKAEAEMAAYGPDPQP